MNRIPLAVSILLALCATDALAAGKIYKCKNEKGEIYYSQAFDASKCGGGGAQLNDQGLAIKQIERTKSQEELAAEKLQREKEAEAARKAEAEKQAEQVLMLSYASEDDLKRGHDQAMQAIDTAISTTELQLQNQQRSLAELLSSAAESERAGQVVSPDVAKNIAKVREQIEAQNAFIARKEQEKVSATSDFDAKLKRYREVRAKQVEGH